MELATRPGRSRRRLDGRLFGFLIVAVFLAYGSPCVPLGHCHGEHVVSSAADRPEPLVSAVACLFSGVKAVAEACHVDPPHGVMPDSQANGPLVSAPALVADVPLVAVELSPHRGILPLPGEPLDGFGLAGCRTGAAALATLCILRT
ncbi:hypothetical protein E1264_05405 [Actinomadura sp. KC216]|uniref:hypothetical protein n=1 Tax=Actinomadura sp. KC216 TaxID=2530370 RepID=UPI0010491C43|nr:hypothetical protein [Actinomadura sp. KC216]TDB90319.1 hypothetical protein E1264_05405 [Actinomadura sp. KC216]